MNSVFGSKRSPDEPKARSRASIAREDGRKRPLVRAMDARERALGSSGLRLLPKTLFIVFAKFHRNESAPLALPEWGGAHLMREASLGKSFKN